MTDERSLGLVSFGSATFFHCLFLKLQGLRASRLAQVCQRGKGKHLKPDTRSEQLFSHLLLEHAHLHRSGAKVRGHS